VGCSHVKAFFFIGSNLYGFKNKLFDGRFNPTYSTGKIILPVLLGFFY